MEKNSLSKKRRVLKAGTARVTVQEFKIPTIEEFRKEQIAGASSSESRDSLTLNSIPSPADPAGMSFNLGTDTAAQTHGPMMDPQALKAAEEKAAEIQMQAERVLQDAEVQAQQLVEEYREKGYEDGMRQAQEVAKEELVPVMRNLQESIEKVQDIKNVILKQNEGEIIDLSLDIARKIIGAELTHNPAMVGTVVKSVLDRIDLSERITVKVNPEEYEHLMKAVPDYLKNAWIVADSSISKGGALVETESGTYDAQIATQLEEIEKKLKKDIITDEG